jgi:ABC-type lipoprotein export system ATPase subunit
MPWLTARENIRLALLDLAPTEQAAAIGNLLRDLGLSDFADALPRQLSGGMAQRVAIARALARKPQVLSCCSMNHSGPSTISRGSSCSIISALFGRSPASL